MKSMQILFFVCLCILIVSTTVSADNFWKELEGIGQRVRDAIISAGPAVDVINKATRIGKHDDDDDD